MFKSRLISSILLVILALTTVMSGGYVLAATLWLISVIAFHELCLACKIQEDIKKQNTLVVVGNIFISFYYVSMAMFNNNQLMVMIAVTALIVLLMVYVFRFPKYHANQIMSTYFSFIYAPVMFSFIYLTRELEYGAYFVWVIFISSWISDTCAYCVGLLLGKHRLAPVLSPKKSIEGSIGGIVGSAIVGALFGYLLVEKVIPGQQVTWVFAFIGAIGSVVSQIGDLAASAIKRNYNIKDYGKLIPGHGGIMDRFDSVLVTAPMIYFLFTLLI